eukprot:2990125-Lingulodinium_polyedra.AAC.1
MEQERRKLLEERRNVKEELDKEQPEERAQEVCLRLKKLSKQCYRIRRDHYRKRKEGLVEDLWIAWSTRDLAEAGRLSRLLAGG